MISWSILGIGAAQARIDQAEARTRGALAHFDGTVLTALRKTETALDVYAHELRRRRYDHGDTLKHARKSRLSCQRQAAR